MELIRQQDKNDCGVANCLMIINHYSKYKTTIEDFKLTHNYQRNEYSLEDIKNILNGYNIQVEYYELDSLNNIIEANCYPILLVVKNSLGLNHYITINGYDNNYFEIYDPSFKVKRKLTLKQLKEISLNITGFIKKESKYKEHKKVNEFNQKYFKRFLILFKENWLMFSIINLITVISSFAFFFSNMFIKVLLTEYAYLTIKRSLLIVLMFVGIVTVWFLLMAIQRRLSKFNDRRVINSYLSYLDNEYDLNKINKSFHKDQQIREINNLLVTVKQQLYLLNNFIGFIIFTIAVILLTSNVSLILLVGTLILMFTLFLLKIWQAKRMFNNLQVNKLSNSRTNYFIDQLVKNYNGINQRVNLQEYLKINEEYLNEINVKDNSLINYLEKISIYLYYFIMIFALYRTGLDISLFLVITNITFVFSHQLEVILTNLNSSYLLNRKLKIINNLKRKDKSNHEFKDVITIKKTKVKNKVVRVKKLKDVLIDYKSIEEHLLNKDVYDCELDLIDNETISNNLFNFGNNKGIENYSLFKLNKYIDELNIDLSLKAMYLNEEQREFIKLTSCLFTKKKIILIKRNKYKWFLLIEKDIKKYLKDKLVIIYE